MLLGLVLGQITVEAFVGLVSLVVSGLAAAVGYLYKVQYVDNRRHHAECKEQLKASDEKCEKRLTRYQAVIDHLQKRVDLMQNRILGIDQKLVQVDSNIHKSFPGQDTPNTGPNNA